MRYARALALVLPFLACLSASAQLDPPFQDPAPPPGWIEFRSSALGITFEYPADLDRLVGRCGNGLLGRKDPVLDPYLPDGPPREILFRGHQFPSEGPQELPYHNVFLLAAFFHGATTQIDEASLSRGATGSTWRRSGQTSEGADYVCWGTAGWNDRETSRIAVRLGSRLVYLTLMGSSERETDLALSIVASVSFFEPEPLPAPDADGWLTIQTESIVLRVPSEWMLHRFVSDARRKPSQLSFWESPATHVLDGVWGSSGRGHIASVRIDPSSPEQVCARWRTEFDWYVNNSASSIYTQRIDEFETQSVAQAFRMERKSRPRNMLRKRIKALFNGTPPPVSVWSYRYVLPIGSGSIILECNTVIRGRSSIRKTLDRVARTIRTPYLAPTPPPTPPTSPAGAPEPPEPLSAPPRSPAPGRH